ncbi:MAG: SLBB domain-containing protein [Methanoregulaceae archaeon]|nr:SLBB domain-containing protein [Methanoregulaceae archaeon]
MMRFLWVFLALVLSAVAVSQSRVVVKAGDSVSVVCEEEPSVNKDYPITRDGYVVMQFIGAVSVAGLTEEVAAAKIAATLIEQRILPRATVRLKVLGSKTALIAYGGAVQKSGEVFPRVGLRLADVVQVAQPTAAANLEKVRVTTAEGKEIIVNFKLFDGKDTAHNPELRAGDRVFFELVDRPQDVVITGMVKRPGALPFKDGMTIRDLVLAAGGYTAAANEKAVRLEHAGQVRDLDMTADDAPLQPGDRVFVPQATSLTFVTVTGAVMTPRRVPFREGLTLAQAVEGAGGAAPRADLAKVQVIRQIDGKDRKLTHNLAQVYASKAGDLPLRANDVVEVNYPQVANKRRNSAAQLVGAVLIGALFGILRF